MTREPEISIADFDAKKLANPSTPEQVFDPRSPEEIEKDLILQQEKESFERLSKMPPDEMAAAFFKSVYPMFHDKVQGLNSKQAKYVLDSLVQYPLKTDKLDFPKTVMEEVFVLGQELLNAKYIITQAAQMDKMMAAENNNLDKNANLNDTDTKVQNILNSVETTFTREPEGNENG